MTYSAMDLAKYIVDKCYCENCPITNLQLQKILYFIQKNFLHRRQKAFYESIEAWKFGPVVPVVYYHFCTFGAMPITERYNIRLYEDDLENKKQVDDIVEKQREIYPWTLVKETHKPLGAWAQVFNNGAGCYDTIPDELIMREA